jgi:hypothetical protein
MYNNFYSITTLFLKTEIIFTENKFNFKNFTKRTILGRLSGKRKNQFLSEKRKLMEQDDQAPEDKIHKLLRLFRLYEYD